MSCIYCYFEFMAYVGTDNDISISATSAPIHAATHSTNSIQNAVDISNTIPGSFYFHSCQSVTINMHTGSK